MEDYAREIDFLFMECVKNILKPEIQETKAPNFGTDPGQQFDQQSQAWEEVEHYV